MAKSRNKGTRGRKRRRSRSSLPWILGVSAVVLLIAVPIVINIVRFASLPGEGFPSQGNTHIALGDSHPPYNSDPPTSGWHTPQLGSWGSYLEPQPDERLIHNLEDGGVILWYRNGRPEENEAQVRALEEVARGYRRIVIAPRDDMPSAYTLTAWQRLQRFDEIDREGMRNFIEAFHGIDHH